MALGEPRLITENRAFADFCEHLRQVPRIAFDTEFIPERTYSPELCLIQVATDDELAVIDPLALPSVQDFWEALNASQGVVVVHAGKHEMDFCARAVGALPAQFVDVQLAAGFAGLGYPLSHSNLIAKVLDKHPRAGETRTDWSARPLSQRQIDYAIDDVRYLLPAWDAVRGHLQDHGRVSWFEDEQKRLYSGLVDDAKSRIRKVTGAGGLSARGMAVLREVVQWRERRAQELNRPPRWILRDDLVAELAKRHPTSIEEIKKTRGLGVDPKSPWIRDLLSAIQRGLATPDDKLPVTNRRRETADEQMVVKMLAAALMQRASEYGIATALVGSNEDLSNLIEWYRKGRPENETPSLLMGWRAEVAGRYVLDLLAGRVVVRVLTDDEKVSLHFEEVDGAT